MKPEIRRILNEKFNQLEAKVEPQKIEFTQESLKELLSTVLAESRKMNPLEQKAFDEQMQREERRGLMLVEQAKAQAIQDERRKNGCSHCRDPRTGNSVARGMGEWTTCGQVHGNDTITLICMRCATPWHFQATPQEREYAVNTGLLGMAPPSEDRLIA